MAPKFTFTYKEKIVQEIVTVLITVPTKKPKNNKRTSQTDTQIMPAKNEEQRTKSKLDINEPSCVFNDKGYYIHCNMFLFCCIHVHIWYEQPLQGLQTVQIS